MDKELKPIQSRLGTILQGPWQLVLRGLIVQGGAGRQVQLSLALPLPWLAFMVLFPIQNTPLRHGQGQLVLLLKQEAEQSPDFQVSLESLISRDEDSIAGHAG